jgi:hypothetical protein
MFCVTFATFLVRFFLIGLFIGGDGVLCFVTFVIELGWVNSIKKPWLGKSISNSTSEISSLNHVFRGQFRKISPPPTVP